MAQDDEPTLHELVGGADGVERVVAGLYRRVLADLELAPFFANSDIDALMRHQRELIAEALGGPSAYTGRSLREAHAGLDITLDHFRSLMSHLGEAMTECGVAPAVIARVSSVLTGRWYAQWTDPPDPPVPEPGRPALLDLRGDPPDSPPTLDLRG